MARPWYERAIFFRDVIDHVHDGIGFARSHDGRTGRTRFIVSAKISHLLAAPESSVTRNPPLSRYSRNARFFALRQSHHPSVSRKSRDNRKIRSSLRLNGGDRRYESGSAARHRLRNGYRRPANPRPTSRRLSHLADAKPNRDGTPAGQCIQTNKVEFRCRREKQDHGPRHDLRAKSLAQSPTAVNKSRLPRSTGKRFRPIRIRRDGRRNRRSPIRPFRDHNSVARVTAWPSQTCLAAWWRCRFLEGRQPTQRTP